MENNISEGKEYMENCYIGVDIGGMSIKGVVINPAGNILAESCVKTGVEGGEEQVCANIVWLVRDLCKGIEDYKPLGIGIGCPGIIDSKNGVVVFAANLQFQNVPLAKMVEEKVNLPVKITNDANAAALGEATFGAGKIYCNSVLVTLGTGVGGGIVIDDKLFEGYRSAGAEIGHMIIVKDGLPCTCGNKGCFEAYSSASALIKKTAEEMKAHPESAMWNTYTAETVSGKTAFQYWESDETAAEVLEWYLDHLAVGLVNIANIFRPQVIMIGGGISKEGDRLVNPLQKRVDKMLFAGSDYAPVKVVKATLGNQAGAFGAAALVM